MEWAVTISHNSHFLNSLHLSNEWSQWKADFVAFLCGTVIVFYGCSFSQRLFGVVEKINKKYPEQRGKSQVGFFRLVRLSVCLFVCMSVRRDSSVLLVEKHKKIENAPSIGE